MVIFVKPSGATVVENDLISLGSHVGKIAIVSPNRVGAYVELLITPPSSEQIQPIYAAPMPSIDADDLGVYICDPASRIATASGRVRYQVRFTYSGGLVETTPEGTFAIQPGVVVIPPDDPPANIYEEIRAAILASSALYSEVIHELDKAMAAAELVEVSLADITAARKESVGAAAEARESAEKAENFAERSEDVVKELAAGRYIEKDPTVPAWAKQPNKPTYTPDEIGAAPTGYGLGKTQSRGIPNNDVDNALENSWYVADASCKHNPFTGYGGNVFVYSSAFMIKQTWHQVSGARSVASRVKIGNTWSEWEYVNPPMQLGVEYLTNERFMGKPVYTMLIDLGETPVGSTEQKTDKEVILTVNGISRIVDYDIYLNIGNKDHPGLIYTFKLSDKTDEFNAWSYAWPDANRLKIGLGSRTEDVFTAYAIVKYLK